jgi:folate-binding protein YgfZ
MLTDMHVLESGTMMVLDVPANMVDAIVARLDQFIFTEDVRVESLADGLRGVWLHGPLAGDVVARALRIDGPATLASWQNYQLAPYEFGGQPVTVVRIDQIGVPGYCVYVESAYEPSLLRALEAAGGVVVLPSALEAARIEAGYPLFGVDMTDDTIPLEAGIEQRAISMSKGCYVGQEIIVRVLHRGHGRVARRLMGLRIDGAHDDAAPLRGARLSSGDRDVGAITSAALSSRLGAIALAYVHRDFANAGARVDVDTPAGRATAIVTERLSPSTP